jgi:hypothetical protein
MTALRRTAACLLLLAAVACSQKGLDARFDYNSRLGAGVDISDYKTWGFIPVSNPPTGDPRIDDPAFAAFIEQVIESELGRRGFEKTESSPDMLVNYQMGIQNKTDDESWADYYAQKGMGMPDVQWEEGALSIILNDPNTGQALWGGVARGELDPKASKSRGRENTRKVIQKLMARFDADRGVETPPAM